MLTLFTAMGLTTQAGGCFHLTLRAREHLVAGSPWNLSPYYVSMKDRPQTLDMLNVLRTGKPANWGSYDAQAWAQAMERPDFAAQFTAAMDCRGTLLGPALAKKLDLTGRSALLDVAGGSGIYACAIVARHPHLRAAVLEKPPVDASRATRIREAGLRRAGRRSSPGDMFRDRMARRLRRASHLECPARLG